MKKLQCVVIDDEPLAIELLEQYITEFPALELTGSYEDAISGADYLRKHHTDLLFIDINMPDISGIDLVSSLEVRPMVVFTTAYRHFAYEGFELEAFDYLLKPIDSERFSKTIIKAIDYHEYRQNPKSSTSDSIYVYSGYKLVRIPLNNITYIESFEDYITVHLSNDLPVTTLMSLKKVLEKLPERDFKRIHRSFIIPVKQVRSIHNRKIRLLSGEELPVGDSYVQSLNTWLS